MATVDRSNPFGTTLPVVTRSPVVRANRHTIEPLNTTARLLSVVAIDSTHARATFASPVVDNPAVTCLASWAIAPVLAAPAVQILAIVKESSPVASVLLTTTEFKNLADYTLTVHILEAS